MKVIQSVRAMQRASRKLAAEGKRIGFVPTMGYLHAGHQSLIRRASKLTDVVVTSVFVNPTQFAPTEDLSRYPRDFVSDRRKIAEAGGEIIFFPDAGEIYPASFDTWVTVEQLSSVLEGAARPGHFRGVTTIVAKLLNIVRPDVVLFGQKDFQQAIILRKMTTDLGYPVRHVIAPTIRERDGLAMSSRNSYFTSDQRGDAASLFHGLSRGEQLFRAGERDAKRLESAIRSAILARFGAAHIEYIAFNDFDTLAPRTKVDEMTVCSLAVRIHGVRLIDNICFKK